MVRANAAALLTDTFPLQNPDAGNEEIDALLQKQFDIMKVRNLHIHEKKKSIFLEMVVSKSGCQPVGD